MGRLPLPISDYITDTKSALDNSLRVLQALCDAAGDAGFLSTALSAMALIQSLMQANTFSELHSEFQDFAAYNHCKCQSFSLSRTCTILCRPI